MNYEKEAYLTAKDNSYKQAIEQFKKFQESFNTELQKVSENSVKETETLIKNYLSLQESNKKWEKLRKITSGIYSWKGRLLNSICNLSGGNDQQHCTTPTTQ
ncbi:hypothetical protein [Candidatus Mycoplasma haematominutum]|uniref:Uncharacterized protein n=1 Tax=Candidatus Mycoplasma haematominutum 'Birmingham 1' TaxID=1116213 RepID=G8C3E4_9MOLU|nr:hypothetical protein [Candidatus Mycoplasma haematominutum]CCE66842.1 hypothetical protein MHM_03240 [Candidatus Mycoplasma haematominutum 'Birmingham 1']